jgi:arylamine N-acetyltransferase
MYKLHDEYVLPDAASFDLQSYLRRVKHMGDTEPTLKTLTALMGAHLANVPQENLDRLMGIRQAFDTASIQKKMVMSQRGDTCIGHALLFKALLDTLGYKNQLILARFRMRHVQKMRDDGVGYLTAEHVPVIVPHGHAAIVASIDGRSYLVDVGLGPFGPLGPIELVVGEDVCPENEGQYAIGRDGEMIWVLKGMQGRQWLDYYSFTMEQYFPIDLEYVDHFIDTFPRMVPFRRLLRATLLSKERRVSIMGSQLYIRTPSGIESRMISSEAEVRQVLFMEFGIEVPETDAVLWNAPAP